MNFSLGFSIALTAGLILLAARRAWLLAVWIVVYLTFPTASTRIGAAPIYLYDIVTLVVAGTLIYNGDFNRWPRSVPRWHWWFVGSTFLLSIVFGALRFGWSPEQWWIWGHACLSWLPFAFGVIALTSPHRDEYRAGLQWGILFSFVFLALVAVIHYADLPGTDFLNNLFYGDLGATDSIEMLRVGAATNRAPGPHFAPTTFSGIALLAAIIFWQITGEHQRWKRRVVLALAAVVIVCTVSRHTMVAAVLGGLVIVALSETRRKIKLITIAVTVVAIIASGAAGLLIKKSWTYRMSKTDSGVLEDDNVAARIILGPQRLAECIARDPTVLLTGLGLDADKLAAKTHTDKSFESGFVSNGFLLALYYLGIGGFILLLWFWWWALRTAWRFPVHLRSELCGCIVMAIIIFAADNYSFTYEPAECLLWIIVGLIGGQRVVLLEEQLAAEDEEDLEPGGLEEANYA